MALDPQKLEKCVDLAGGMRRARCPACAEQGQDKTGEHLRIYPDGRFGCCVYPRDREHRKRIFALAGEHVRQGIKVRVAVAKSGGPVQAGILGRLGRLFASPAQSSDGADGVREAQAGCDDSRTLRTGVSKSNGDSLAEGWLSPGENENLRTLRTPLQYSRVYLEKEPLKEIVHASALKEFGEGVRSVREGEGVEQPPKEAGKGEGVIETPKTESESGVPSVPSGERLPYLDRSGGLVIPFNSPERYHYWKPDGKRMSVKETLAEVRLRMGKTERKDKDGTGV